MYIFVGLTKSVYVFLHFGTLLYLLYHNVYLSTQQDGEQQAEDDKCGDDLTYRQT